MGCLVAGREEKDQCGDESAVGSDVDSFFGAGASEGVRRESVLGLPPNQ